jgi:hypothetical protein
MTRTVVLVCVTTGTWANRPVEKHKAPGSITLPAHRKTCDLNRMKQIVL